MVEISVKLKSEDANFTKKFAVYENNICLDENDPYLLNLVAQAKAEFKGQVEEIVVKTIMVIK